MRYLILWTSLALTVAGCSGDTGSRASPPAGASDVTSAPEAAAAPGAAAQAATPPPQATGTPAGVPLLAYSYNYALRVPVQRVAPLIRSHEQRCSQAGPTVCQVLETAITADPENRNTTARLRMRARPDWLTQFRSSLDADARGAGGVVANSATTTEDLTRSIVDTEATLRARATLRDRLQQLLATRSGPLADMLALEQELARVQGEIDAAQAQLSVMRTRVATSSLDIAYASRSESLAPGMFEPLSEASNDFARNAIQALAVIITLVSVLLPFALVGALILWVVLALRRRGWFKRKPKLATPPIP